MRIILASKSPRRKELLSLMGLTYEIIPSEKEENMCQNLSLSKLSESLAKQKADDIFSQTSGNRVVIGSDTMVVVKHKLFGKPKSKEEAKNMLKTLSGNWHKVATSLCVIIEKDGIKKEYLTHSYSKVKFLKLSEKMIDEYLQNDEYKDKAGAYAVQGKSGMFIEKIKGSYSTIIGLPTHLLFQILYKEEILKI
ncbi:MAG: septum formation protein Maf [Clostridiales bacterium]|nr:septum formation protein Maf [Clostridiales bacterium]